MTTFDIATAYGRLRTLWNATADPQLAMSDDEIADVETVLQEHAAMADELRLARADYEDAHRRFQVADMCARTAEDEISQLRAELAEARALVGSKPLWRYRAFGPNDEIVLDPGAGERWSMAQLGGWRIEQQPVYHGPWELAPDLRNGDDDV